MNNQFEKYIKEMDSFIIRLLDHEQELSEDFFETKSFGELHAVNKSLYADILDDNYFDSYANPEKAVAAFGKDMGEILAYLYADTKQLVGMAYEGRREDMESFAGLFGDVKELLEDGADGKAVADAVREYEIGTAETTAKTAAYRAFSQAFDTYTSIVDTANLEDLRYLFRYGMYIGSNEIEMARYLNSLPEDKIQIMADTYTGAYFRGFVRDNKSLEGKKTVLVCYPLGFERVIRKAFENFREKGLEPLAYYHLRGVPRPRMINTKPSKQMEFDQRFGDAPFYDNDVAEAMVAATEEAYAFYQEEIKAYSGLALMEIFGEKPFSPVQQKSACKYSDEQSEIKKSQTARTRAITNRYLPGDSYSFTIISFPVPEIGKDFESIFEETIKINTLDNDKYMHIQQSIIDVLDKAKAVHITGRRGNRTDLTVALQKLSDPTKETNFNNCTADVNVPVGEVFTTPRLEGTNGVLHVSETYLHGYNYLDLEIVFEDGMTVDYGCGNFEDAEESKAYLNENLMHPYKMLPLGEFAIGTNTTAYVMSQRFGIEKIIPILIGEKMGPHFAIGDTCYTWEEDLPVYNPDGKEITARENERTCLRSTDPAKAYTFKHTDITIPYTELGDIRALNEDGSVVDIIRDGRFVLEGTEALNEPFFESVKSGGNDES